MSFSIQTLDNMLSFFVGRAPTLERKVNMFLGLSTTEINPDGTGITEPIGNNYTRSRILTTEWNNPYIDGIFINIDNEVPIQWSKCVGGWGNIKSFFVTTTETGIKPLAFAPLRAGSLGGTTFISINNNDILQMPSSGRTGGLQFRLSGAGLTNVVRSHLIGHMFNKETWTPFQTLYFGLSTTQLNVNGGSLTELIGNGYDRVKVNMKSGFTSPIQLTNDVFISNAKPITWPQADTDWGVAPYWFASELATGGTSSQILMYGTLSDQSGFLWDKHIKQHEHFSIKTGLIRIGFNYEN